MGVLQGTSICYSTLCMHRRADLFGDTVDDFDPSRWERWTPAPWTYVPFNGGPRICLGQNFALTEMAYATARIVQTYERMEERSGIKYRSNDFKNGILLSPSLGVQVGLIIARD